MTFPRKKQNWFIEVNDGRLKKNYFPCYRIGDIFFLFVTFSVCFSLCLPVTLLISFLLWLLHFYSFTVFLVLRISISFQLSIFLSLTYYFSNLFFSLILCFSFTLLASFCLNLTLCLFIYHYFTPSHIISFNLFTNQFLIYTFTLRGCSLSEFPIMTLLVTGIIGYNGL